jgi:hypothetical protein
MSGYSKRIFLSYAEEDLAFVEALRSALNARGHRVWHYQEEVYPDWRKEVEQQIRTADYGIVVWSRASVRSKNVLSEAQRLEKRNRYVPVRVDGADVPAGLDIDQIFDLSGWTGDSDHREWTRLLRRLDQTPIHGTEPPPRSPRRAVAVRFTLFGCGRWLWARLPTALVSGALGMGAVAGAWVIDNKNFADAVNAALEPEPMNHPHSEPQIEALAEEISKAYSHNKQVMWFHFIITGIDTLNDGRKSDAVKTLAVVNRTLDIRQLWVRDYRRDHCPHTEGRGNDRKAAEAVNEAIRPTEVDGIEAICQELTPAFPQEIAILRVSLSR